MSKLSVIYVRSSKSHYFLFLLLLLSVSASFQDLIVSGGHSLNRVSVLFSNLGCYISGDQDVVIDTRHNSPTLRINIVDGLENFWSFVPTCNEVHDGIGNFCVYTRQKFSNGRGISIFTRPHIAEKFASLAPLYDPSTLNGINNADGPWYTKSLPGKGTGMLAKHDLKRGDLITAFTPVLLVHPEKYLSTLAREALLRKAIGQLPVATRDAYLNLATIYGDPTTIVQDVLKANTFEVQVGGEMHLAIFPETARMNHDCAPNSQYYIDHDRLTHYVHATRPIAKDEEITISYINPIMGHDQRQQQLEDTFHFACNCARCQSGRDDDLVLDKIQTLQEILGVWAPTSHEIIGAAEKMVSLYKEIKLDAFLDMAYGHAALAYLSFGDAEGARKYAGLAAEAVLLKNGKDAADYRLWREVMNEPEGHWSWKYRLQGPGFQQ